MSSTKQKLTYVQSAPQRGSIEISANEFETFKLFLKIIKSDFTDFSLANGAFRSFTYDREHIVETGFSFFRGFSFYIFGIKSFLKSVSSLDKKSKIRFNLSPKKLTIKDDQTTLSFLHPVPGSLVDNPFISYEEMEDLIFHAVDPEKIVFVGTLSKKLVSRAKKMARKSSDKRIILTNKLTIPNQAHIVISVDSDQTAEYSCRLNRFYRNVSTKDLNFNLPAFPFKFEQDHHHIQCFYNNDQTATTIFNTNVNDLFVNIYWKSELPQ